MIHEEVPKQKEGVQATSGMGLQIAGASWGLALLFFTGGYFTFMAYFLLPVLALVGVIVSVVDLVHGRKWALLGLVLSCTPLLLIIGAIMVMAGGHY